MLDVNTSVPICNGSSTGCAETTDEVPIPTAISVSGTVLGIFLIATGVFGNALVILSVIWNKHLCKAANVFIISLAACDIFQNIMVKPLYIHTYVAGEWIFGRNVCLYVLFASNVAILESILHITSIAVLRYVVVVHPRAGHRIGSPRAVAVILLCLYLVPIGATLGLALPKALKGTVQFNRKIMFCSFVKHNEFKLGSVLKKVGFLTLAALVILYCCVRISIKSKRTLKFVNKANGENLQNYYHSRVKNDLALLKTVKIIFYAFIICFLPLSILYGIDRERKFPFWLYFIGVMLLWCSSSINWIIFFCVNRRFRKAYRNILCGVPVPGMMSLDVRTSARPFRSPTAAVSLKSANRQKQNESSRKRSKT